MIAGKREAGKREVNMMKIRGDTQMAEIIDSHERRLRMMELAMVGAAIALLIQKVMKN